MVGTWRSALGFWRAVQLVKQAGTMAKGGEVFVVDVGEPVRVIELAGTMIELSSLSVRDDTNPEGDIAVEVIGLRDGEKLYEELLIGEDPDATEHVRMIEANDDFLYLAKLGPILYQQKAAMNANNAATLRQIVTGLRQIG